MHTQQSRRKIISLLAILFTIASIFIPTSPVRAANLENIYFVWNSEDNGTVRMYFQGSGYVWGITERLSPNPQTWVFRLDFTSSFRRMIVGYNSLRNAIFRVCVGVADSNPGDDSVLLEHDNNRCFRIWLDPSEPTPPTLHAVEIFNVYGRVTDSNGAGIGDVTISNGAQTVKTASDGNYSFSRIFAGTYTLTASKDSYTFSSPLSVSGGPPYNVRGKNFVGTPVPPPDTTNPDGTITAPAGGSTFGPGAVSFTADAWDNAGGSGVNRVEFYIFYDGTWHYIDQDTSAPYGITWNTPAGLGNQQLIFTIHVIDNNNNRATDAGGYRYVNFVVPVSTYSIGGRVTDSAGHGLAGVTISDGAGHTVTTDGNGNYSFGGLPAGSYTLTPDKVGHTFSPASRSVTVPPDAGGQNFEVTNRYSIAGRVTDQVGQPVVGVPMVCQQWGAGNQWLTATDGNGYYTCVDLPGGFYSVRCGSGSAYTLSPAVRGPIILLLTNPHVTNQNFTTVPVYGSVNGRVTAQGTGLPINGARVSIGGRVGNTNANGDYNLPNVLPGMHNVYVSAAGYQDYAGQVEVLANAAATHNAVLTPLWVDGYRLPYPGGQRYQCTQGNNSRFSHTGRDVYAFDFGIAATQTVAASRAGKVVAVKTDGTPCGYWQGGQFICSKICLASANYVRIVHTDGTDTRYYHLSRVDVKVGDEVRSGQVLGLSGSTGCSTGAHLHFGRYKSGQYQTIPASFLDVSTNNGVPVAREWYTSGNYASFAALEALATNADTEPPVGTIRFQMTGQPTFTLQLTAFDYGSASLFMRLASTAEELTAATWQPFAESVGWIYPQAWVQFKDATEHVSAVYSDTVDPIVYEPIQAAFTVSPTLCVGAVPAIQNQTTPFCEQCGWHWDLGDGNESTAPQAELPYPYMGYLAPGTYTIALTVTNAESFSTVSHPVTVIWGPATRFTVLQSGTTITVTAEETDATSWNWDFGDGTTATGRIAVHTYTSLHSTAYPVQLTVNRADGCNATNFQYVMLYRIHLPLVLRMR